MATVTLTTLRSRVRERADMAGSNFVADTATGLDAWINEANQKLHGMLVDALGEEYVSSSSALATVADTSDYALPTGFFKLYGVDLTIAGYIRALLPYNRMERNAYRNDQNYGWHIPRYSIVGSYLRIYPTPTSVLSGTIYYAPEATVLTAGTDSVSYPNGWERFIVLDAAIQALLKEESSVTALIQERDAVVREIAQTKENRDLASPKQVVDVGMINAEWW